MSYQPGIYFDIGRKAKDLLYTDYITRQPPDHYHFGCFDSNFLMSCQIKDIVPGLGTVFKYFMPYQRSSKAELQYLHDFAGVTAGFGLTPVPLLNFSAVVGTGLFSIGTDISFDSSTKQFAKYNAGFSFNSSILIASLTLNDKCDNVRASFYRPLNPSMDTAVAAEVSHGLLRNETIVTLGAQHAVQPLTLVKGRVNSRGEVGALVQQGLLDSLFLTFAGELDLKAITRSAKFGLSLAVNPRIHSDSLQD